ncbi:MAG: hypothetical protein JST35_10965 [Armatimonadetes bacterium]|nr:hypothetical protein [Armatimonadota bacterium]
MKRIGWLFGSLGLVFAAIGALAGAQEPAFDQAWQKVQSARATARGQWSNPKLTQDELKKVTADLEALKAFCLRPEIRNLKAADGSQLVYFQRNDILVDLIICYGKLGDRERVVTSAEELRDSLTGEDSWIIKENKLSMFSFYANRIASMPEVIALLPDPRITKVIGDLRRRDPDWMLAGIPYPGGDTDKITAGDRIAGLSMIWSEAKYNFANWDLVSGLDWDGTYRQFIPRVAKEQSRYEYYDLLREFMALLKDAHTDLGLPESLRNSMEVRIPLPIRRVQDHVVIWREPSPSLAKFGFRAGDVIETIDGVPAIEYGQRKWGKLVSSSTPQGHDVNLYTYMLLRGPKTKKVVLGVEHADGTKQAITVRRDKPLSGVMTPPFEFKILADGTAYFAFNTCNNDVPALSFERLLPEIRKAGRLIIDVRLNEGGNSGVGASILSHLVDRDLKVGKWETRNYRPSFRAWDRASDRYGEEETLFASADKFTGPVAVICGPRTFSAAEDFLCYYRASGRGKLVGMPTGGSTGQPMRFNLPGGGWARICTKRDRNADGTEFVGVGFVPDIRADSTVEDIRAGRDPALAAAQRVVNGG